MLYIYLIFITTIIKVLCTVESTTASVTAISKDYKIGLSVCIFLKTINIKIMFKKYFYRIIIWESDSFTINMTFYNRH